MWGGVWGCPITCNLAGIMLRHLTVDIAAILTFLHDPLGVFVLPLCHVQSLACSRGRAGCLSRAKTPCQLVSAKPRGSDLSPVCEHAVTIAASKVIQRTPLISITMIYAPRMQCADNGGIQWWSSMLEVLLFTEAASRGLLQAC